MRIETNLVAPYFKMVDIFGRIIDLDDYKDKKLLIAFFRHAGCPFCNVRVHALQKIHPELKAKGMEMIFFFESKERVMKMSTFHQEISPIPLISDPEKKVYAAYGIEQSVYKSSMSHISTFVQTVYKASTAKLPIHLMKDGESFSTMPAEFLVGKNLIIKDLHYSERLNDRMNIEKVKAFADSAD